MPWFKLLLSEWTKEGVVIPAGTVVQRDSKPYMAQEVPAPVENMGEGETIQAPEDDAVKVQARAKSK